MSTLPKNIKPLDLPEQVEDYFAHIEKRAGSQVLGRIDELSAKLNDVICYLADKEKEGWPQPYGNSGDLYPVSPQDPLSSDEMQKRHRSLVNEMLRQDPLNVEELLEEYGKLYPAKDGHPIVGGEQVRARMQEIINLLKARIQ